MLEPCTVLHHNKHSQILVIHSERTGQVGVNAWDVEPYSREFDGFTSWKWTSLPLDKLAYS